MSYYTNWYAVDKNIFDAVVRGTISEYTLNVFAEKIGSLGRTGWERSGLTPKEMENLNVPFLLEEFFRHCREGTEPSDRGYEMTLLISLAIERLGTLCGDITEGSPSILEHYHNEVYSKHEAFAPLSRAFNQCLGFSGEWPFFTFITKEEVRTAAKALKNIGNDEANILDEEIEALESALEDAMQDGRDILTITS